MPNRLIKESITTSEDIDRLSLGAEILFYRLMVKVDDFGIYYGNAKLIRSECFPLRADTLKATQVEKWLEELDEAGLIRRYTAGDGRTYLQFTKWEKHQQIRAQKSKFPQFDSNCCQLISNDINGYQLQVNVPVIQSNPIQSNPNTNPIQSTDNADAFDVWWAVYPKKVGKDAARRAFAKVKVDVNTLIAAVVLQRESEQWAKEGGRYIPNPATWLNQGRWEDELAPAKTGDEATQQNTGRNAPPSAKFTTVGMEPFTFGE